MKKWKKRGKKEKGNKKGRKMFFDKRNEKYEIYQTRVQDPTLKSSEKN